MCHTCMPATLRAPPFLLSFYVGGDQRDARPMGCLPARSACVARTSRPWSRPIIIFQAIKASSPASRLLSLRGGSEQTTATAFNYCSPCVPVVRVPCRRLRMHSMQSCAVLLCCLPVLFFKLLSSAAARFTSHTLWYPCRCAVRRKTNSPSHPSWRLVSAPASSPFSQPLQLLLRSAWPHSAWRGAREKNLPLGLCILRSRGPRGVTASQRPTAVTGKTAGTVISLAP